MSQEREPHNPFYILLLASSLAFVVMALAVALVPVLEDNARAAGNRPPTSEFRANLRSDGWLWLLYEGAAVVVFAILSMFLDRLRRLKRERAAVTIPPASNQPSAVSEQPPDQ